jgi:DinB superfamily
MGGYLSHDRSAGVDGRWTEKRAVTDIAISLVNAFDYVWDRLTTRLEGLTDDEYLWEPVAGCWSLRADGEGRWRLDGAGGGGPAPDPVPVTTIAWRLGHLGGLALGGFANRRFGDGSLTAESIDFPGRATDVGAFLDGRYRSWRHGLVGLDAAGWEAPLGELWGAYAEDTTVDLALHVLDEVVHHGAEVGVLRDLYAHRDTDVSRD